MSKTQEAVQRCIDRCAKAKDGRGRWPAYRDCVQQLAALGCCEAVAGDTASAARRIGEWLATQPASAQHVGA